MKNKDELENNIRKLLVQAEKALYYTCLSTMDSEEFQDEFTSAHNSLFLIGKIKEDLGYLEDRQEGKLPQIKLPFEL